MTPSKLNALVKEKINNGMLPSCEPARLWAGPGSGELCVVCDTQIKREQMEFEVEAPARTRSSGKALRFHSRCHTAWSHQCTPACA
jgi:hypothetical protein